MNQELSKREKKLARQLIDKGIQSDFKIILEQAAEILSEWEAGNLNNKEAYHKLYKEIQDQNEFIARRYDNVKGSTYLITVAQIYADGLISEDDIKDFSDETRAILNNWLRLRNEE